MRQHHTSPSQMERMKLEVFYRRWEMKLFSDQSSFYVGLVRSRELGRGLNDRGTLVLHGAPFGDGEIQHLYEDGKETEL